MLSLSQTTIIKTTGKLCFTPLAIFASTGTVARCKRGSVVVDTKAVCDTILRAKLLEVFLERGKMAAYTADFSGEGSPFGAFEGLIKIEKTGEEQS